MEHHYMDVYERFKQYNRTEDYEVEHWEPRMLNEIIVYMKNGDVLRYDNVGKTIAYCRQYERDEFGDYMLDEKEYREAFASKLRRVMTVRRMNQRMLSDETGISATTLSHYMNGRNLPDLRNVMRICRALDCSVEELTEYDY